MRSVSLHSIVATRQLTERLEDGVGLEDLLLHPGGDVGRDGAQVLQDELGALRLARPRLAADDQRLVDPLGLQLLVGGLGQGEDVGLQGPEFGTMIFENCRLKLKYRALESCSNVIEMQSMSHVIKIQSI